jgi:hypothetical protein
MVCFLLETVRYIFASPGSVWGPGTASRVRPLTGGVLRFDLDDPVKPALTLSWGTVNVVGTGRLIGAESGCVT